MAASPPVLELRGITKRSRASLANDHVDLDLRRGRGARAARRERRRQVDADEHPLRALPARRGRDPRQRQAASRSARAKDAIERGHRHGAPALHADPGDDGRREHRARHRADARRVAPRLRAPRGSASRELATDASASQVDPDARVEDITVGQQQRVEILKALYRDADILILDEPTAVLTPQEATELFDDPRSARGARACRSSSSPTS